MWSYVSRSPSMWWRVGHMEKGSGESALRLRVPANGRGHTGGSVREKEIKREQICQVRAWETGRRREWDTGRNDQVGGRLRAAIAGNTDSMMKFPSPQSRNNIITERVGEVERAQLLIWRGKQFKKKEITKEGTNKKKTLGTECAAGGNWVCLYHKCSHLYLKCRKKLTFTWNRLTTVTVIYFFTSANFTKKKPPQLYCPSLPAVLVYSLFRKL